MIHKLSIVLFLISFMTSVSYIEIAAEDRDILTQVSTINALMKGIYDGSTSFKDISSRGDFGIGTFNELDGEMIGIDGVFYQIKIDGKAYKGKDTQKTPFATVTFFDNDKRLSLPKGINLEDLHTWIDKHLPSENIFYALRIDGRFKSMKTRSVPLQTKPYKELKEVLKEQAFFNFKDIKGTIAGFRWPSYVKGINVPGYHFHFITDTKDAGGHVLNMVVDEAVLVIDETDRLFLNLPEDDGFRKADLTHDKTYDLKGVEKE